MLQQKNSYIYSFEGKDVYNKVLKVKEGKKRKATLDYSLETIEMEKISKQVLNKRRYEQLFFQDDNAKQYTNAVINMTFKYNAYEYNMLTLKKDKYYIHHESKLESKDIKDMEFKNGLYIIDNVIQAVKLNDVCNSDIKLPRGFKKDSENKIILNSTGFLIVDNSDVIREKLYQNGFELHFEKEKVKYVRYKRSGGASRVGKCLFIREELYKRMMEWSMMNLDFAADDEIDLAGIQAYIALTTSSIIDVIELEPNNILLIDDYESTFKDTVMVTEIISEEYNDKGEIKNRDRLHTLPKEIEVSNNIWDGQSLLDESVFAKYGYEDKGFLLGRNQFFKSACFNSGIQRFFKDNNITDISQLNGRTIATNIEDIKLITTPSSIKYLKYGTWDQWLENIGNDFGIVKYDKPTHYFRGKMVQTHYQLLNTLQMSESDMREFLNDSVEYIKLLKTDIRVFREHLHIKIRENIEYGDLKSTDEFIMTMLQLNNKFENTNLFKSFRQESIKSYVNNIKRGHVLINGNYSVMCGNGLEMLKNSCNLFDGSSILDSDEVVCKNFEWNKKLIGSRSPHVTMGNIWLNRNASESKANKILEYMNGSKQIVYVNSIGNNLLERLSSCDFDSDTVLLSDNELLIKKAEMNYKNFSVPTSHVVAKKIPRKNNYQQMCDLDIKTSKNLIGQIINCSQVLNSQLWDLVNKGHSTEEKLIQELYQIISQLDVMSCIEIDKAKKEFSVDNQLELDSIRDKYIKNSQKPIFFKFLAKDKGNPVKPDKYRDHTTSMDYLINIIDKEVRSMNRTRRSPDKMTTFGELFSTEYGISMDGVRSVKSSNVLNTYNILRNNISSVWMSINKTNEEKYNEVMMLKEDFNVFLSNLKLDCRDIKKIIIKINKLMNDKEVSNTYRTLLSSIYHTNKDEFIKVFEDTKEDIECLLRVNSYKNTDNLIKLYDIYYKILKK